MLCCPQKLPVEIKTESTEQMGQEDGNPGHALGSSPQPRRLRHPMAIDSLPARPGATWCSSGLLHPAFQGTDRWSGRFQ